MPLAVLQEWKCLFDTLPKEWMESVQLVLDYFCERTPRSFVEVRDTSLVWNYKHADVEFGRLQARDLLQVRARFFKADTGS
jgi:trehalose 6-phosphate synthase/phosphatase